MSAVTLGKLRTFEFNYLIKALETKDKFAIIKFLTEWGLEIKNKKIVPMEQYISIWKEIYQYWDKKQLVKKINLNSALTLSAFS